MDLKQILEDVKSIAYEAGKYAFFRMNDIKTLDFKEDNFANIVTDVDKLTEKIIVDHLRQKYPDFSILSEEGNNFSGKDYKWLIDPIDGTSNFVHGFPFYAVSIGLEFCDEIILGVVYNPVFDEMYYAIKNEGSFLNGKKLAVTKNKTLSSSLLATGFANNFHADPKVVNLFFDLLKKSCSVRRMGSAALHLCYLAAGRLDGYWEIGLSPWDTAGGILILTEAGGKVTDFWTDSFSPYLKTILGTNSLIHTEMQNIIKEIYK